MSLGSQYGAHDGTDPLERAIDTFTDTAAGRIVVVASGNDNGDNIHKQLVLAPGELKRLLYKYPPLLLQVQQMCFNLHLMAMIQVHLV